MSLPQLSSFGYQLFHAVQVLFHSALKFVNVGISEGRSTSCKLRPSATCPATESLSVIPVVDPKESTNTQYGNGRSISKGYQPVRIWINQNSKVRRRAEIWLTQSSRDAP